MRPSPPLLSLLHVVAFLAFSAGWVLGLSLVVQLALLATGVPLDSADPDVLIEVLGGVGLGLLTMVQIGVLAAAAWSAAGLLGEARVATFPLGRPSPWLLGAAVIGGLTLWTLPSLVAERMIEHVDAPSTPELLADLLRNGPVSGRVMIALAIGLSAPLCEEVVFRGYLWRAVEIGFGPVAALFATTTLFAAYHLDAVQSLSLIPVAVFLGWLRLRSGSLWPAFLAHLTNNLLGLVLTVAGSDEGGSVGPWVGVGGLAVGLLASAVASRYAPPPPPAGRSSSST